VIQETGRTYTAQYKRYPASVAAKTVEIQPRTVAFRVSLNASVGNW
jgi:hypothetical protein